MSCNIGWTTPSFEFVELRTRNELDRQRQRVAVRVRLDPGGASRFLGDVWRSTSTGRWHFTTGPLNLRRGDRSAGYCTREDAAQALLDARIAEAEAQLRQAADEANALRRAAGKAPVAVIATSGR